MVLLDKRQPRPEARQRPQQRPLAQQPIAQANADPRRGLPPQEQLIVNGIKKSFKKRMVVKGVSINLSGRNFVGLLGPNGAGKTTVFYMITGLIKPDEGSVFIEGYDVTKLSMYRRRPAWDRLPAAGGVDLSRPLGRR